MEDINTVVRAVYGTGHENCVALVIGSCDAPQFLLQRTDGTTFWWRQDLCRGAKEGAELEYWKQRAAIAEKKLESAGLTA